MRLTLAELPRFDRDGARCSPGRFTPEETARLDEAVPALMVIPGSPKQAVIDAQHDLITTRCPLWRVDHELITRWWPAPAGRKAAS